MAVVRSLLPDGAGGLWIGTWQGLARLDAAGQWTVYNENNSGLPSNFVDSLLPDGAGGLWIGTDGLARLDAAGQWTVYNTNNSDLPGNSVNSLLPDGAGGLWIGTWGDGLARLDAAGQWMVYNTNNSGLPNNEVDSLLSDGAGGLWIGTWGDGLARLDAAGQWTVYNTNNSGLPGNDVRSLLSDGAGGLWIGTRYSGLARLDAAGQWMVYNTNNSGLPNNEVDSLLSDGAGGLWIGTRYSGLARLDAAGQWTVYNTNNSGLPSNSVDSLLSDGAGGLWIGTRYNGLAHLTFPTSKSSSAAILIAGGGNVQSNSLWATTENLSNYLYQTLVKRGFANGQIYYLSPKDWADFNGDGFNDRIVDAPRPVRALSVDDVRQAFAWAQDKGKLMQPLYVFLLDHGGNEEGGGFEFLLSDTVILEAATLKTLLDEYQSATGNDVVVMIDACYSGAALEDLKAPNRAIIASTGTNSLAYFDRSVHDGFSRFLGNGIMRGMNLQEAFSFAASKQTRLLGQLKQYVTAGNTEADFVQTPMYEDNQNGLWLKDVYVNGPAVTADASLTVTALTASEPVMQGKPVTLQAQATLVSGKVQKVWAVLRPPRMNLVMDAQGTPILGFPILQLSPQTDNANIWETLWTPEIYNGDYHITFYAEDKEGTIADSDTIVLTVNNGIDPPTTANVTLQTNQANYRAGEQLTLTLTENLGWGYDLYVAIALPDGTLFTVTNPNEIHPLQPGVYNGVRRWQTLRSQGKSVTLLDFPLPAGLPAGDYCFYGLLSPQRNDVFAVQDSWVMGQQCVTVQ